MYRPRWTSRVVLVDEDEKRLTAWMNQNLRVSWCEHQNEADRSGGFEPPAAPSLQAPKLPDVPEMPTLPNLSEMPRVPDSVANDAQRLWQQFTDWLSKRF
jgi:hypothetical protein